MMYKKRSKLFARRLEIFFQPLSCEADRAELWDEQVILKSVDFITLESGSMKNGRQRLTTNTSCSHSVIALNFCGLPFFRLVLSGAKFLQKRINTLGEKWIYWLAEKQTRRAITAFHSSVNSEKASKANVWLPKYWAKRPLFCSLLN